MKRSKSPAPAKAAKEVREVEVKMEDADILRAGAAKLVGVLAITMIVAAAALYVFHEQHRKSTHTCVKLFSLFGDATSCTVKFGPASHHDEYFLGVLGLFLIWAMYAMEASAEYALSLVGLIAWWTFSFYMLWMDPEFNTVGIPNHVLGLAMMAFGLLLSPFAFHKKYYVIHHKSPVSVNRYILLE